MIKTIKELFLIPPIAMIIVMAIALVRPALIFGGIHFGGILGIFIPVSVVLIIGMVIFYLSATFFPDTSDREGIVEIIMFISTIVLTLIAIAMMIICLTTIPKRTIYIKSSQEFNVICNLPYADKLDYCLESDIDFEGQNPTWLGQLQNYYGTFDGNGHTIKNLKISNVKDSSSGFGLVGSNYGKICNLRFESCEFNFSNSSTNAFGIIAGYNYNEILNCSIINCYQAWNAGIREDIVMGGNRSVSNIYIGGLVGLNKGGLISGCEYYNGIDNSIIDQSIYLKNRFSVFGDGVSGKSAFGTLCGGIVGYSEDGIIENCVTYGSRVQSDLTKTSLCGTPFQVIGGLVGRVKNSTINSCLVYAECSGISNGKCLRYVGELTAFVDSAQFSDCYIVPSSCNIIGNNSNEVEGIYTLPEQNVTSTDLPKSFANWKDTSHGYPTPYFSSSLEIFDTMIWVWIILGAIVLSLIAYGVINYIISVKKKY